MNRLTTRLIRIFGVATLLGLAACNFPGFQPAQPEQDRLATAAAQTVAAQLTQVAGTVGAPSPLPPATLPLLATATATPVPPPTTTPTPACTNQARFVRDISIPDDTNVPAGDSFDKVWRLQNVGTCTWTPDYDVVFESGNIMAGPPSSPLPGTVVPQAEVDIRVSLKAPSADGTHRGNWKLRSGGGVLFGIGTSFDRPFFVQIVVGATPTPQPGVVKDFVATYCLAEWVSGPSVVTLTCPGKVTDTQGFVIKLDAPKLENGSTENEPALWIHPQWVDNGVTTGKFPAIQVKSGDRFKAVIGCLFNGLTCSVRFQLNYRADGGSLQTLGQWDQTYDGNLQSLDLDLSPLAGKSVEFVLAVLANGPSNQDWAFWLAPRVVGPPR
ncbi:MAG: NBR1-Ig-like domain-containing protein [Chloroflexota bacterium]